MHESETIKYTPSEYHVIEHTVWWCGMMVNVYSRHKITASWDNTHDCPEGYDYDDNHGEVFKLVMTLDETEMTNGFNQIPEMGLFDHVEHEINKYPVCGYDLIENIEVEYD